MRPLILGDVVQNHNGLETVQEPAHSPFRGRVPADGSTLERGNRLGVQLLAALAFVGVAVLGLLKGLGFLPLFHGGDQLLDQSCFLLPPFLSAFRTVF